MTAKERLLKTLFDDQKRRHINIKFCRGTSETISEDALCREVSTALFQSDNKLIKSEKRFSETLTDFELKELSI